MMMFTALIVHARRGGTTPCRQDAARKASIRPHTPNQETRMSLTMYSASVPIFLRTLGNIGKWLDKAEAHAQAKKFDVGVLLGTRLSPDMLPFTRQVQMTSDAAKFGAARLAGIESPKFDDVETTLP